MHHLFELLEQLVSKNDHLTEVILSLPRFTLDPVSFSLRDLLQNLGMHDAFDEGLADFSNIGSNPGEIRLDDVFHQAFVTVNEEGTEAAAATAAILVTRSITKPVKRIIKGLTDCSEQVGSAANQIAQVTPRAPLSEYGLRRCMLWLFLGCQRFSDPSLLRQQ